jgi:uncharacterized protein (DUF4415 family)
MIAKKKANPVKSMSRRSRDQMVQTRKDGQMGRKIRARDAKTRQSVKVDADAIEQGPIRNPNRRTA